MPKCCAMLQSCLQDPLHHIGSPVHSSMFGWTRQGKLLMPCAAPQGLADPAGRITNDAPGLQLAIALGASVYLLSEKKRVPRGECCG